ncbi:lysoplasmalogenase [Mycoplasmatota bacterium]|nr:lysoplasmalogenase [Mycoplasmatota bacterium]
MLYLILALIIMTWLLFICLIYKKKRLDAFYIKGLTSFLFVFLYMYGIYHIFLDSIHEVNESTLISLLAIGLGLILGLLGDLFLEVQYFHSKHKERQIKYGMIVFGLGHLFYILAMIEKSSFNYLSLLIALFMTLFIYLGAKLMSIRFGKLKAFTYGYSFIIFTMVGQSIFQALDHDASTFSLIFMLGAILFGISDLLLAPIYFKKQTHHLFVIANLFTYYLGQTLIALSIYFMIT